IGVRILCKGFRAPGDRACVLGNIPRRAAIPGISLGAIMREARMLRRRMKFNVSQLSSRCYRHAERLDSAIEVLIIERVLIKPGGFKRRNSCYFISHEPDTIVAVIRFDLSYGCVVPSGNSRLLSHGVAQGSKSEGLVNSDYVVLAVRSVVIHVALVGMTLAPSPFVWHNVFRFGKIRCPLVYRSVQVVNVHQNSVRRYVMNVASMVIGVRVLGEISGEWIDPGARTDQVLGAV